MDAQEILNILIEKNLLKEGDIEKLERSSQNPNFRRAVEAYHALMCTRDHDHECNFHEETIKDNTWERKEHTIWADEVTDILTRHNISLNTLLADIQYIGSIESKHTNLSDAGKEIFKLRFIPSQ